MSKRLQVIMPDDEFAELKDLARKQRTTVGEWVRRALRRAAFQESANSPEAKLAALRKAMTYSFPTADIEQMNREIDEGHASGLP